MSIRPVDVGMSRVSLLTTTPQAVAVYAAVKANADQTFGGDERSRGRHHGRHGRRARDGPND